MLHSASGGGCRLGSAPKGGVKVQDAGALAQGRVAGRQRGELGRQVLRRCREALDAFALAQVGALGVVVPVVDRALLARAAAAALACNWGPTRE